MLDCDERQRIEIVIARNGYDESRRWAKRIAGVYRAAVLDPDHFAHTGHQRRQFIQAYVQLKRFAERGILPSAPTNVT